MSKTRVVSCPQCKAKIALSIRDDGEVTLLGSEEKEYSPLEELRKGRRG